MDKLKLLQLIRTDQPSQVASLFETRLIIKQVELAIKQYDPKQHPVTDTAIRRDKHIYGAASDEELARDPNAKGPLQDTVRVARLTLPIQKRIVNTQVAFLGVPGIDCTPESNESDTPTLEESFISIIDKIRDDNKYDYRFKKLMRAVLSEKHAAEIWYTKDVDPIYWDGYDFKSAKKIGMMVVSPSVGDELFPGFDDYGDLMVFIRRYKTLDDENKEVTNVDMYTAEMIWYARESSANTWEYGDGNGNWSPVRAGVKNEFGKIPVIYYYTPLTAWEDVQPLIERLETKISNHADTNDYFDSPMLVGNGLVKSLPGKDEHGKVLELQDGGDVKYVTWDQAPESMKMEIENLQKFIFNFTNTPDISFESMKSLGAFSGIALQTFFIGAHFQAAANEEIFGEGVQRQLNLLKAIVVKMDPRYAKALTLKMKPKFTYYLPKNDSEQLDNIIKAKNAGIQSTDTSVRQNPQVTDADAELIALNDEKEEAAAAALEVSGPPFKTSQNGTAK